MRSNAPLAPARRGVADLERRIDCLNAYQRRRPVEPIDFATMVGAEAYAEHWHRLEQAIAYMKDCQVFAETLRKRIGQAHRPG